LKPTALILKAADQLVYRVAGLPHGEALVELRR
ncbi:MAG: hypothetical protein ACI89D_001005, partial [Bermanella sp.]